MVNRRSSIGYPNQVRMASTLEGPDTGDYLFNLIRFAGCAEFRISHWCGGGSRSGRRGAHLHDDRRTDRAMFSSRRSSKLRSRARGRIHPITSGASAPACSRFSGRPSSSRTIQPFPMSRPTHAGASPVPVPREGPGGSRLVFRDLGMDSPLPARERARRKPRGTDENQWRDHIRTIEADTKPRMANTRDASTASNLDPWYLAHAGRGQRLDQPLRPERLLGFGGRLPDRDPVAGLPRHRQPDHREPGPPAQGVEPGGRADDPGQLVAHLRALLRCARRALPLGLGRHPDGVQQHADQRGASRSTSRSTPPSRTASSCSRTPRTALGPGLREIHGRGAQGDLRAAPARRSRLPRPRRGAGSGVSVAH